MAGNTSLLPEAHPADHCRGVCFEEEGDLKQCGGCHGILYCSVKCQQVDWPGHKLLCKAFGQCKDPEADENGKIPDGAQGNYYRVIFFHPDKPKPEILWLRVDPMYGDEARLLRQGATTSSMCGFGVKTPGMIYLYPQHGKGSQDHLRNEYSQASTKKGVKDDTRWTRIIYRDEYWTDDSTENKSLLAAVSATTTPNHDWRGPFTFSRQPGYNINMADYRYMIAHLTKSPWLQMGKFSKLVVQQVCTIKGSKERRDDHEGGEQMRLIWTGEVGPDGFPVMLDPHTQRQL